MFGKYTDVSAQRDVVGAVVFYFAQMVVLVGLSSVLVHFLGMAGVVDGGGSFFDGGEFYTLIGTAFVLLLSGAVLRAKGMTNDLFAVVCAIAAIYLSWDMSVMIGMIPVALLTTMKK